MKKGDHVRVDGESSWCVGTVEDIHTPDKLPRITIEGKRLANETVGALLKQAKCTRVAMISFEDKAETKIFAALELPDGWQDLQGQRLKITTTK